MKRNLADGVLRIVIVLSVVTAIGYEVVTMEGFFKLWLSWNNGLVFAFKIILIPAAFISLLWWAFNWCRKGFTAPRLNWKEGGTRIFIFLFGLSALLFFIWIWAETENLGRSIFVTCLLAAFVGLIFFIVYWIDEGFNKPKSDK